MRTLAIEGDKRYREVFDLIRRREASRPNEIWQADHTELDLWVLTPSGKPAGPWLTIIEDDHSRVIAGYATNLEAPSAIQTALALRQAIWRKPGGDCGAVQRPRELSASARINPSRTASCSVSSGAASRRSTRDDRAETEHAQRQFIE